MSSKTVINIGRAYTRFPLGRKKQHGKGSGEEFRELFLLPALQGESPTVVIELDDTLGYGSSFLEEAFGGLVRAGYKPDFLKSSLSFISDDPSLVEEINSYIDEAAKK